MPVVRIDPPKRGSRTTSRAATGAAKGFLKGGYVGAALGGIAGLFPQGSAEERAARYTIPVEFDTDTGEVNLLSQNHSLCVFASSIKRKVGSAGLAKNRSI